MKNQSRKERGFTLVELLIVVAIILVIVAIAVPSYLASVTTAHQTAATENLKTMSSSVAAYQSQTRVFPALAANMGNAENSVTVGSTCAANEEMKTAVATGWDAGIVQANYTMLYKAGGTTTTSSLGCAGNTLWEATAVPLDVTSGTAAFCADPNGLSQTPSGTAGTPASGAGCQADGYTASLQ